VQQVLLRCLRSACLRCVACVRYHPPTKGEWVGKRSYDNHLVGANITLSGMSLAQWQAMDPATNDVGSTYLNVPIAKQGPEIIAAARKLLAM
jgi:hypothetical protein